jgi:hypothetical protein
MNEIAVVTTEEYFKKLDDPHPESKVFTNVKLYNHLLLHNKAGRWCSIDCMTREFEGRSSESNRTIMRRRLSVFQRWCQEAQNHLVSIQRGRQNGALAAKLFHPTKADDFERQVVADDLSRALHRREITETMYQTKLKLIYPVLESEGNGAEPQTTENNASVESTEEPPHADIS